MLDEELGKLDCEFQKIEDRKNKKKKKKDSDSSLAVDNSGLSETAENNSQSANEVDKNEGFIGIKVRK